MTGSRVNRRGAAPRSALVLLVLLAAAIGALLVARQKDTELDFTLGGPLFPVAPEEIEGLLVTRQGSQFRLDRSATGSWSLSGAVTDFVDSLAVQRLLDEVSTARGGPLLPGTDVEDRRYEFNGPEAVRLTVFAEGAGPISLALGAGNPVGGNFYGSGAEREACFLVSAAFHQTLDNFPLSVQARTLLPGVTMDKAERVDLLRGTRDLRIERREDRWWLLMPPEGPGALGEKVADYQARYEDRRMEDEHGTWILASTPAVQLLIYEVSTVIVREIMSPAESVERVTAWDLDPPWRRVTISGPGINPDPRSDSPDQVTIAFGPALGVDKVPALRLDNVLVTDMEAINVLNEPLDFLAHRSALTFGALGSDAITLEREGRPVLRGTRTGVAETPEGRMAWLTDIPRAGQTSANETMRHGYTRGLAVNLDRIEVLAALPPTSDPAVLADRERVRITITFGSGETARTEVVEFGFLNEDALPAGSPPLVLDEAGAPPVGVWFPETGCLLQVPDQIIVTARSLAQMAE